ncbi:hypothetical protein DV515_00006348 [Chloebia gouldiae]|uniref:Uncharacterized protein n=1 Tax=Chloebia gouldiae TaxID=44316 RepID=A0A3L8SKR0_CHLGU|nr:hypothetical protein DV515_00006348 [Chloebia gouldiae]
MLQKECGALFAELRSNLIEKLEADSEYGSSQPWLQYRVEILELLLTWLSSAGKEAIEVKIPQSHQDVMPNDEQ